MISNTSPDQQPKSVEAACGRGNSQQEAPAYAPPARLAPHHVTMLREASGLTEAMIVARGYWTATTKAALTTLGFAPSQCRPPALVIPVYNPHGEIVLYQTRADIPRIRGGKPLKYETPAKAHMALDVPPLQQNQLRVRDPQIPLWITEGVKKGDALVTHDCCAVALLGVWNWRGTNNAGGKTVLADFESIALNGRTVYLVFDSDVMTKPEIHKALERLGAFLTSRHAAVRYVYLHAGESGQKVGVDDFLATGHTVDDLLALATPTLRRLQGARDAQDPALPWSDTTNAEALVREHGQHLRYCYTWKSWLVWTGTHWQRDTSGIVMRLAKQTMKQLGHRALDAEDDALLKHVKRSLNTAALEAMIKNAQSVDGIAVQPEELDADPWLLNCANGTLDLRTKTLRPHRQADLLTKCLTVSYDATATCPTWERFQWRIMGGSGPWSSPDDSAAMLEAADERATRLIDFKQRALGYSLTGDTREQCLFVAHGTGSNGKSTELEILQALLGEYAQSTPSASLLAKERYDGVPNDIARLRGARLVTAVEIGEGKRLNEELVKRLTGQDTLTARFLHAEFFDFRAQFKLFIACNHLPKIRGTDHAIWRRIKLIPFTVTIPDKEQVKTLPATLREELPGILAWAVRGCLTWQQQGLETPDEVIAATKSYRESMDVIGRFIEECCLVDHQTRVKGGDIYTAYKKWCETSGEYAVTLTAFGNRLEEQGFPKHRSGGIWRLGIGLIHDAAV